MLTPGKLAPEFSLPDADLSMVNLADFRGKGNVVLFFYPKDMTTGCTIEALEFTNLDQDFQELNTTVLGISRDNCMSHATFRDEYGLSVRLLADKDGDACEAYGVWQSREKDGVKKMATVRSTFILDRAGTLRYALYDVIPKGHAAKVLDLVKNLD